MSSLKCKNSTENINPRVLKTNNGKIMLLEKCATCGSKKSRFIKKHEASAILSSLGLKTPLSVYLMMFCFECNFIECNFIEVYKMNEISNKFLLTGDKFMPEMHLKQPKFTYSVSQPFTKNKERIQKFKETEDARYIYIYVILAMKLQK